MVELVNALQREGIPLSDMGIAFSSSDNQYPDKWCFQRAIRHLIEVTWVRGDLDVLDKYFGNTISASRGKPTNGEFIARIANVVKSRMREAA